jgi:hypothetical protein
LGRTKPKISLYPIYEKIYTRVDRSQNEKSGKGDKLRVEE